MRILGIETSCDETAASVVKDGRKILSNVVVSQIDIFAEYGGVIPEVAARSHLEAILPVVRKALSDASCSWEDIDAIAVTHAPGLLGSLLIGTLTARTLAILHNKPLYAVHHLKSHVYSNWLSGAEDLSDISRSGARPAVRKPRAAGATPRAAALRTPLRREISTTPALEFPLLALVVSGGHTQILRMQGHNQFEIVGTTVDDAVGECFDKVAKILGLPYPGGPSIALAAEGQYVLFGHAQGRSTKLTVLKEHADLQPGDANKYRFPHPKVEGLNFSFSGLKTAVLRAVQKELGLPISHPSHDLKNHLTAQQVTDFAASFQKTAVEILIEKLELAVEKYPETRSVVVAGGVSANEELRSEITSFVRGLELEKSHTLGSRENRPTGEPLGAVRNIDFSNSNQNIILSKEAISLFFPAVELSGDNGAMVGAAAFYEILSGVKPTDPYSLNIYPRVSVEG